jgi:adenosylmethionine-8-amino-7-oxononanoate aminotransferase
LGVLLIVDEVITGMGRTGEWFMSDAEGVVPDLVAVGKGLSAGYSPVAAVLLREHLVRTISRTSGVAPFGHTFSGNPLGAATCLAVLDHMEDHDVLANVRARGVQLEAGLRRLASQFACMADVRGRGLLWGFELVSDPDSRTAPPPERNAAGALVDACFDRGLIVYPGGIAPLNNAVILCPPLTISPTEVEHLLAMLEDALAAVAQLDFLRAPDLSDSRRDAWEATHD